MGQYSFIIYYLNQLVICYKCCTVKEIDEICQQYRSFGIDNMEVESFLVEPYLQQANN